MIELIENIIIENLPTILTFILTIIATFVGKQYNKYVNDETKRKVVKTVVKAVEQLYKDLDGTKKLKKAKESILEILEDKGIKITDLELSMLIEEVCNSFKKESEDK